MTLTDSTQQQIKLIIKKQTQKQTITKTKKHGHHHQLKKEITRSCQTINTNPNLFTITYRPTIPNKTLTIGRYPRIVKTKKPTRKIDVHTKERFLGKT